MALTEETTHAESVAPAPAYDGFMSYSHAADELLAPRLQAGLQRFAKPWWKRRALRVFRDEASLSANPHLWSSIVTAMNRSEWFVLLLSVEAASSEWVNREVEYWITHKDPSRIVPVVTDGEFEWDNGHVSASSTAAPPALSDSFPEEPRWVDLRWARTDTHLDLSNARFRDAVADIASAIRGIPKDELESEEVVQHRRTIRTAWGAATTLVLMVVLAVSVAVFAFDQRSEARRQAQIAQEQAALAVEAAEKAAAEALARAEAEGLALAEAEARLQAEDRADEFETRLEERRGTVETPIGEVSFFRISGDNDSIPFGEIFQTSDGIVAVNETFGPDAQMDLWHSPDGREWTRLGDEFLPNTDGRFIAKHAGLFWLLTSDPSLVWYSEDLLTWNEWHLPEVPRPNISGVDWWSSLWITRAESLGDSFLIPAVAHASLDLAELVGIEVDEGTFLDGQWNERLDVLEVITFGPDGDKTIAAITFEVASETELVLGDADTGEVLGAISIADQSTTATELRDRIARRGGPISDSVELGLATLGGAVEFLPAPWEAGSDFDLVGVGDEVFAFVGSRPPEFEPYDIWRTSDGISWEQVGTIDFGDAEEGWVDFIGGRELVFANVYTQSPTEPYGTQLWISADGTTWEPVATEMVDDLNVMPLDTGYVVANTYGIWLSRDGIDWHSLASESIGFDAGPPMEEGSWDAHAVGNQFIVTSIDNVSGQVIMWVFTLELNP